MERKQPAKRNSRETGKKNFRFSVQFTKVGKWAKIQGQC